MMAMRWTIPVFILFSFASAEAQNTRVDRNIVNGTLLGTTQLQRGNVTGNVRAGVTGPLAGVAELTTNECLDLGCRAVAGYSQCPRTIHGGGVVGNVMCICSTGQTCVNESTD